MPAKITLAMMFTCPSPPRSQPTVDLAKSKMREVMFPVFMIFPA